MTLYETPSCATEFLHPGERRRWPDLRASLSRACHTKSPDALSDDLLLRCHRNFGEPCCPIATKPANGQLWVGNRPRFCRLEAWLRLELSAFQDSYDAGLLRIAKLTFSRPRTAIGITQFHA